VDNDSFRLVCGILSISLNHSYWLVNTTIIVPVSYRRLQTLASTLGQLEWGGQSETPARWHSPRLRRDPQQDSSHPSDGDSEPDARPFQALAEAWVQHRRSALPQFDPRVSQKVCKARFTEVDIDFASSAVKEEPPHRGI